MKRKKQKKLAAKKQPTNRQYKDRLFKAIFGQNTKQSKQWRLDLYNALNGTDYKDPDALKVTTIENVIYITMKNDISFLIDTEMNLYEQQSTFNPNMPLRGLMYFAQLYQRHITDRDEDPLGSRQIKIPSPKFIVFYNGDKKLPDMSEQRLSDAFEGGKVEGFEWTATVINIGVNHNEALQKKCKPLYDYCEYVNRVKQNINANIAKDKAIEEALEYAIKNNLLDGYFKMQKMEVLNMSLTEFDQELYDRNRRQEGFEDGVAEKAKEDAKNFLAMNVLTHEQIAKGVGLPIETIEELAAELTAEPAVETANTTEMA